MKYLVFLLGLFFSTFANSTDPERLEIVSEHWPPFIVQIDSTTQHVGGLVTEKIKQIFDNSAIPYQIMVYPWARSYHLAKTKPNVLIYSIFRTPEREPYFHWFCPIHEKTPVNIYKLKNNAIDISTLAPLKSAAVGVLRNDNSHTYMLKNGFKEKQNLIVSSNEETNIKNILNGKIDVVIQSRDALIYRLKNTGFTIDNFEAGYQLHKSNSTEHCMALSKSSSEDVRLAIEKAFKNWRNESH